MSRPTSFNTAIGDEICRRIAEGESLRGMCEGSDMPHVSTVFRWLADPKNTEFRDQYAHARDVQAETIFDQCLQIADDATNDYVEKVRPDGSKYDAFDAEHVQRSKLRIETRKWMAGKLAPKKYGEKSTHELTGPGGGPIETMDLSLLEGLSPEKQDALRAAIGKVMGHE